MSEAYAILGDDRKRHVLRSRPSYSPSCTQLRPGGNTTAPLAPLFRHLIRRDNILKQRPPDPLNNQVLNTFGRTTPETAHEIPWVVILTVHDTTITTNTRAARAIIITRIIVPSRDRSRRIQAQIHFRTRSCRERRVIAVLGLELLHSRTIFHPTFSRMVFRVQVPRPGRRQVVSRGIPRQPTAVRRKTRLQQRVELYVHSGRPGLLVLLCSSLRSWVIRNGHHRHQIDIVIVHAWQHYIIWIPGILSLSIPILQQEISTEPFKSKSVHELCSRVRRPTWPR